MSDDRPEGVPEGAAPIDMDSTTQWCWNEGGRYYIFDSDGFEDALLAYDTPHHAAPTIERGCDR